MVELLTPKEHAAQQEDPKEYHLPERQPVEEVSAKPRDLRRGRGLEDLLELLLCDGEHCRIVQHVSMPICQGQHGPVVPGSQSPSCYIEGIIDSCLWQEGIELQGQVLEETALSIGDLQTTIGLQHHSTAIAHPYEQVLITIVST